MKKPTSKAKPPPEVKAKPGAATEKAAADKKKANAKKADAKKTAAKKKKKRPIVVLPPLDLAGGVGGLDPMMGGVPGPMGAPGMPGGVDPMMQGGMGLDPMAMQMQQQPIPPGPQGMPLAPDVMPRKPLPRRRLV